MNDALQRMLISLVAVTLGALPAITVAATPVVVELFTSQGCSSCPPADALLGELARKPNIVALAYHVDYWDELGWKDPYAIPEAAQRQRGYVQRLSKSGAFTPQAVVSGDTSLIGSNRAEMVGDHFWGGATGPYYWVDPQEKLVAIMMLQALDATRRTYYRSLVRSLVYPLE